MLNNHYIIIDIETIPDKQLIEQSVCKIMNFNSFEEYKKHEEQFVKPGKTWFPKIIFHKPVCIGLLFISNIGNMKYIDFYNKESDKEIIESFWETFDKCNFPTIITYAGKSFDMVVLENRGLKYFFSFENDYAKQGLIKYIDTSDTWEKFQPNYKNKFSHYHIDLIEQFGQPRASLIEACTLFDISVKNTGHGSHINNMNEDEIRQYCREDIFATCELWLKTQINLSHSNYKILLDNFYNYKNKINEN